MPLVVFEARGSPDIQVPTVGAGRLLDVCDEQTTPIPFSCRGASCGTCRVDVLEGAEWLEPPADDELDILDLFGDDPTKTRLACQMHFRDGPGRLRVRPSD